MIIGPPNSKSFLQSCRISFLISIKIVLLTQILSVIANSNNLPKSASSFTKFSLF